MTSFKTNKKTSSLKYASSKLKSNKEIAIKAIKNNIDAYNYIHRSLKYDVDIVLIVLKNNGETITNCVRSVKR